MVNCLQSMEAKGSLEARESTLVILVQHSFLAEYSEALVKVSLDAKG